VLAKIGAVLPKDLRETLDDSGLLIGPGDPIAAGDAELPQDSPGPSAPSARLGLSYRDKDGHGDPGAPVWPFGVGFFEKVRVVMAWCELRQDFRHFRTDRTSSPLALTDKRYPRRAPGSMPQRSGANAEGTSEA